MAIRGVRTGWLRLPWRFALVVGLLALLAPLVLVPLSAQEGEPTSGGADSEGFEEFEDAGEREGGEAAEAGAETETADESEATPEVDSVAGEESLADEDEDKSDPSPCSEAEPVISECQMLWDAVAEQVCAGDGAPWVTECEPDPDKAVDAACGVVTTVCGQVAACTGGDDESGENGCVADPVTACTDDPDACVDDLAPDPCEVAGEVCDEVAACTGGDDESGENGCVADPVTDCAGEGGQGCVLAEPWAEVAEQVCAGDDDGDGAPWVTECQPDPGKPVEAAVEEVCGVVGNGNWEASTCEDDVAAVQDCSGEDCVGSVRTLLVNALLCRDDDTGYCPRPRVAEAAGCVDAPTPCADVLFWRHWVMRACVSGDAPANATICPTSLIVRAPDGEVRPYENGSEQLPFSTITAGLSQRPEAPPEWSGNPHSLWPLAVRAGTYTERVTLSRPVRISGSGATLAPPTTGSGATLTIAPDTFDENGSITPGGNGSVITGLRILPSQGFVAIAGPTVTLEAGGGGGRAWIGQSLDYSVTAGNTGIRVPEQVDGVFEVRASRGSVSSLSITLDGEDVTPSGGGTTASVALSDLLAAPEVVGETDLPQSDTRSLRIVAHRPVEFSAVVRLAGAQTGAAYGTAVTLPSVTVFAPQDPPSAPAPGAETTRTPAPVAPPEAAPGPLPDAPTDRLSGGDRVATAAAVSRANFAGGTPTVFVATGSGYADALAGGPAAARVAGPILLAERDALPEATREELRRLAPARIVVLGGRQAIGESVERELAALARQDVRRLSGADRYATAAAVSAAHFSPGVDAVYVATGEGFADALAGGAAAAARRGPVLLVRRDAVPAATGQELRRLAPKRIVVLGGSAAVSEIVALQLRAYTTGAVDRLHGPDRYGTAAAVVADAFTRRVDTIYVATGEQFPDALAGVPAAGREGAPLLLVGSDRLPPPVAAQLDRLRPRRIVILGGERSVSLRLERELRSYEIER